MIFTVSHSRTQDNRGFSLLELVIVLAIISIFSVVTVNIGKNTREYDGLTKNEIYMNTVQENLMTFVKANFFLPCPDVDGDGIEDRINVAPFECEASRGRIPFLDIGVSATDAWNQPLFYTINARAGHANDIQNAGESASYFNNGLAPGQPAPVFNFTTPPMNDDAGTGNYQVCGEDTLLTSGCTADSFIATAVIAVVVSFGQNGAATWKEFNLGVNAGLDAAETENVNRSNRLFWLAPGSHREGQNFDDQLFWITGWDVKSAVISSGGSL